MAPISDFNLTLVDGGLQFSTNDTNFYNTADKDFLETYITVHLENVPYTYGSWGGASFSENGTGYYQISNGFNYVPTNIEITINDFVGKDFSSLKEKLSEKLVETISPIGKNIAKLMKDKKHLEDVLEKGKQKASILAEENLKKIREIVGFV